MKALTLCVLLGLAVSVKASCFFELKNGTKSDCTYEGVTIAVGQRSKLPPPKCLDCSCGESGLSCCGYGINAGVVAPPPGCKVISKGCSMLLVDIKDETKQCLPDFSVG